MYICPIQVRRGKFAERLFLLALCLDVIFFFSLGEPALEYELLAMSCLHTWWMVFAWFSQAFGNKFAILHALG